MGGGSAIRGRKAVCAAGSPVAGTSVPRRDGPDKLIGRARFVDDLVFPGAWYGAMVRSTTPHARLLAVERDPDFDWSHVMLVTAAGSPGDNVVHLIADDQPTLAADVIRHVAEPVALVAAPDPSLARAARDHVRLRTEPLPPVLDPLASDRAIACCEEAELVVEGTSRVGSQEQLYIEPQGMIAIPPDDGGITVHGSLQCPYYVHAALARPLGIAKEWVVV